MGAGGFYEAFCTCLCHAKIYQCKRVCLYLAGPPPKNILLPSASNFPFSLSLQRSRPEPDHKFAAVTLGLLMGKRELVALLNLSSWCLVMVERLFLLVQWGCLRFVIVVFPDHTHLLFLKS